MPKIKNTLYETTITLDSVEGKIGQYEDIAIKTFFLNPRKITEKNQQSMTEMWKNIN